MLKEERQSRILELLQINGKVVATELSQALSVSEDTIRRDLRDLSEQGRIHRVHGGGLPHSPAAVSYQDRLSQSGPSKRTIASAAVKHIQTGQVVFLDGGTTNLQVAQLLSPNLRATFITNSPTIATTLSDYPEIEVILIGGRLDKEQQVVIGAVAENLLRTFHFDVCFLGVCSIHPIAGITVPDLEEASFKRSLILQSDHIVALASSEKLDTSSPFFVCPLIDLDILITNRPADLTILESYKELDLNLEIV